MKLAAKGTSGPVLAQSLVISVDAMGGDNAPAAILDGVADALVRHPQARFLLHGDEARLRPMVAERAKLAASVEIRHAPDVVAMDTKPGQALRGGRSSSMWAAIAAVGVGEAQVAISAGNTGALMAIAKYQLRTIESVARPAIACLWPTQRADCVVLDVGANLECDADQLVQFAVMGAAFARHVFGLERPTVGLLNVGVEDVKGHDEVKAAAQILRQVDLPFIFHGFVEGDDICAGTVDVVVTDGFTGNVALKTAEGTAKLVATYLRAALNRSFFARLGAILASGAFAALRAKMDPRTMNGGTFLGLNGVVVKSHGGTDAMGFSSALDLAVEMAAQDLPQRIAADVSRLGRGGRDTETEKASAAPGAPQSSEAVSRWT